MEGAQSDAAALSRLAAPLEAHRRHQSRRTPPMGCGARWLLLASATLLVIAPHALGARGQNQPTPAANFELTSDGGGGGGGSDSESPTGDQQRQANAKQIDLNALVSQELPRTNSKQQQQLQVSHKSQLNGRQFGDSISDIQIECNSNNIMVTLQTSSGFSGMIYPKGLSKNSTCMTEYHQLASNITYFLPLKSCNTMSTDVEDGVEYFNTVMVQPHRRLVTNQGRGYHIRCRYQTKERTITNQEQQLSVNLTQVTPAVMGSASMPSCTMRIYSTSDLQHEVSAENVRIGDELQLIITLDEQDVYGMLVTNCLVRDGMNWGEQPLIDERGCPVDEEIMPQFVYAPNLTRASVTFQAHKFPYTSSVYYQCNVRLCFRDAGCQAHVPPNCGGGGGGAGSRTAQQARLPGSAQHNGNNNNYRANELDSDQRLKPLASGHQRQRRWVDGGELDAVASDELLKPKLAEGAGDLTLEVSSGLRVSEREAPAAAPASALDEREPAGADPLTAAATNDEPDLNGGVSEISGSSAAAEEGDAPAAGDKRQARQQSEREFCMSLRKFAIVISLISLLLMAAIILLIACLIRRRNRQKLESQLNSTYDHHQRPYENYDGAGGAPYANRAYCRD